MNDEQLLKLAKIIAPEKKDSNIADNLQRIGVALTVAGLLWVGTEITGLDKSLAVMQETQRSAQIQNDRRLEAMQLRVEDNASKLSKPRFGDDDFKVGIAPILQKIDLIQINIKDFISANKDMDSRIRDLEKIPYYYNQDRVK